MGLTQRVDRFAAGRITPEMLADPYGAIQPTPITGDRFFAAPSGDLVPGVPVRDRTAGGILPRPRTTVRQFMVGSTDALGRSVAVTATLMEPRRPWRGRGSRPVVVHNVAIDSLGTRATPSYRIVHGIGQDFPTVVPLWLQRGYAVLIPDHQGPRMAYAEGTMAGHAVLDSIRGLLAFDATYAASPIVLYGYSGGAIATAWAAQLHPTYAPELDLRGAVAGGSPVDVGLLRETMNGTLGSGLFGAAIIGMAREHPALVEQFSPTGLALASMIKDLSVVPLALGGLARLRLERFSVDPGVFDSDTARAVIDANTAGRNAPTIPVAFYHGASTPRFADRWIPEQGVLDLVESWRGLGASVEYHPVFGDHFVGALSGLPYAMRWVADRFRD
ncbi:lipase [Rhodococcus sp. Leaf7]|uniref:lipase family protein n=1 Tax=unclassified Rhodococcus (in: high G+C Gram-positive bacteria) TaxID=192944 RepID=UPI0006FA1BDB|nr:MULTISPECIES: lipase family protein [unclassified Rhodococcus (in: high G+C Gram-positive bacteria)]KQU06519.1 lipase [Rhodococcus sp. Leaf7]KQU42038.1 lipase [Rhodococcus sp. Leaf247]